MKPARSQPSRSRRRSATKSAKRSTETNRVCVIPGLPIIGWRTTGEPDRFLRGHVSDLNVIFRTDDNGTLTALVAEGLGAAVVPLLVVNPRNPAVVALPLGGRLPPRVLGLVRHRDRYRSDASQAFVELAAELGADFMRRIQ